DHFFGAYSVRAEDIDGDGWMDVTGAANTHDEITWWRNNDGSGTSWIERIVDPNCDGAASVYTQDINGDGYMDILSAAMVDDDITWWENVDGSGVQWTEHIIDGDFDGACYVYSEDIDSDGDMDVLGAAYYAGEITWWENSDTSPGIIWTEHNIATGFTGASCVIAGDINDDGFMDILATPRWATGITWWENDGNAVISWTEHLVCSDFGYISAYPADVDDDGDMDVLAAGIEYDVIEWWENLGGAGTSWTGHTVENNFSIANCVYAEDINGDGVMDVLGSSYSDDEITWWNLEEYSSEASFESSFFDTQGSPDWDYLDWNADTPPGTSVSFCVRTSEHPNHPEAWSDTLDFPCSLEGVVQDEHRYIQYAAIFTTSNPDTTPTLSDVSISWNPLGIERTAELIPSGTELLPFIPNPASTPAVRFGLHEPASVDISVFDMSGRLVFDNHGHEYSQGYHNIALVSLSSGIYFCRLAAGDYSATQRFVVIE
ncbi:MAG: T9SS type A sorting domain-containing protein, partial [Candidatus Fermentibacteria bacterium]